MLSFGLCIAGAYDGRYYRRSTEERERRSIYIELKPVSDRFEAEALAVNGLDRDELKISGADPQTAMREADRWVRTVSEGARAVLVAYPVAFDWSFLYWYFVEYNGSSPFGFSSCLDIRTLYQARALGTFDASSQRSMPPWLRPDTEHTHNAADDALEQAELFSNIFEWALANGGRQEPAPHPAATPNWITDMLHPELPPPGVLGSPERRRRLRLGRG